MSVTNQFEFNYRMRLLMATPQLRNRKMSFGENIVSLECEK